jgi:hypothetical protein
MHSQKNDKKLLKSKKACSVIVKLALLAVGMQYIAKPCSFGSFANASYMLMINYYAQPASKQQLVSSTRRQQRPLASACGVLAFTSEVERPARLVCSA